jgi:hypothetical protein
MQARGQTMPTNRKRKFRVLKHPLTRGERHLLETGNPYPPKGSWKEHNESWLRPFILASPAGRDELKKLWMQNKNELKADWQGPGLPWAAMEFDGNNKTDKPA